MTTHMLKTDPLPFQDVVDDAKRFELRYNDRDFQVGDILVLQETRYSSLQMRDAEKFPLAFTGRKQVRIVGYILQGQRHYGLDQGWVVLGFL